MSLNPGLQEWLELLELRHSTAINLGLDRCLAVWDRMGKPRPANQVFTVAGTNGKGSTVATLCSLLDAQGMRYGCYTTPHIMRYNERVQVQGREATDDELVHSFERVEAARGDLPLSYFEFGTLAAIDLLARAKLDFAVLEVGLGGRLDAVNVIDPDCAVVTPIGLDHQEFLGDTRNQIAREKAGILRRSKPAVCADPDPADSLLQRAKDLDVPLKRLGKEFDIRQEGALVVFRQGETNLRLPAPVLSGPHQLGNLAGALAALLELLPQAIEDESLLARGIEAVKLPGRMQKVLEDPIVWVDVGHNPLAAGVIAETLRNQRQQNRFSRCRCVLGMLVDKEVEGVVDSLDPWIDEWFCAGLEGERGQTGDTLAAKVGLQTDNPVHSGTDVAEALERALCASSAEDAVLVFGSFFTVADAMLHPRLADRIPAGQEKTI